VVSDRFQAFVNGSKLSVPGNSESANRKDSVIRNYSVIAWKWSIVAWRDLVDSGMWNIRRAPVRESDAQIRNIRRAQVRESDAQIRKTCVGCTDTKYQTCSGT
jgi:hypothetical protein